VASGSNGRNALSAEIPEILCGESPQAIDHPPDFLVECPTGGTAEPVCREFGTLRAGQFTLEIFAQLV
jgi:hypothetical protein